jgi:hypothetical protein
MFQSASSWVPPLFPVHGGSRRLQLAQLLLKRGRRSRFCSLPRLGRARLTRAYNLQPRRRVISKYINKMEALAEEMAASGRPLEDDELIEYILPGLNQDYDPIASAVIARIEQVSLGELYSQLLAFETCHVLMSTHEGSASSANAVNHG